MTNIPNELKYTKSHQWVKIDGEFAVIGITDFAQKELTDIVFVDLPKIKKIVFKDKNLANVESVKSVSEVFSPLTGEVVEVNNSLIDAPDTINSDCYGKGWFAKLEIKDPSEIKSLLTADDYKKLVGK